MQAGSGFVERTIQSRSHLIKANLDEKLDWGKNAFEKYGSKMAPV